MISFYELDFIRAERAIVAIFQKKKDPQTLPRLADPLFLLEANTHILGGFPVGNFSGQKSNPCKQPLFIYTNKSS